MYFITNENNNIIAASKDCLEKFGSRDICSISKSINNRLIIIDNSNSKITFFNKEDEYNFAKTKIFSALGELYLYQLFINKKTEVFSDDSDIEYLKKIKDGAVKRDDNFSIPEIKTKKDETKDKKLEVSDKTEPKVIKITEDTIEDEVKDYAHDDREELDTKIDIAIKELEIKEPKEQTKEETTPKLFDSINEVEESTEVSKDIETKTFKNEVLEINEPKEEITKVEEVETKNESTNLDIIKELEKIETNTKDVLEEKTESLKPNIEEKVNIQEVKEEPKENLNSKIERKTKTKKSGLDFIKSKLFPWGSKSSEDIELEEEPIISSAKDIIDNDSRDIKESLLDTNKTSEAIEDIKIEELNKVDIDKEEITDKNDDLTLEEEELLILKETTKPDVTDKKDIIKTTDSLEIKDNVSNEVIKEAQIIEPTTIEPKVEKTTNKEITEKKVETKGNKETELLNKLVSLQAESIDFEKNAKNISIDLDNYKLLLGNFLDELENYKEDIKNGNSSTIDMLTDASTLLSLEPITKKLNLISSNYNKDLSIKELNVFRTILKDRLNGKAVKEKEIVEAFREDNTASSKVEEAIQEAKEEIKEFKKEKPATPPAIPLDAIELDNATNLLASVKALETDFDLDKPTKELSLPKSLILEFVSDFIAQSKEHLPILIDSYKNRDIKQLQTTAHMLKGAASNLRLDNVANTLFSIQKENNLEKSANLIKEYASEIKGLEALVKNLESDSDEN